MANAAHLPAFLPTTYPPFTHLQKHLDQGITHLPTYLTRFLDSHAKKEQFYPWRGMYTFTSPPYTLQIHIEVGRWAETPLPMPLTSINVLPTSFTEVGREVGSDV